ncbi:hypothetical protein [Acinetobacter sp. WZC-1]|uniref:hypothetical protein n=1 Tax=Acinetobacter sp. WZC-1 TaxID=3459034 RepID=UPI00403E12A6
MSGEKDAALLGIYQQICDKKNKDNKNNLLVQAAQRFQQLGQNLKALQLINTLHAQNIQSTILTDTKFLAGVSVADTALKQMREHELRYLTEDGTYPVAKGFSDEIALARPTPVIVDAKADDEAKAGAVVKTARSGSPAAPVTRKKKTVSQKSKAAGSGTVNKQKATTTTAPATRSGANPFKDL